ncbi:hypothetical protein HK405_007780 [Cladochytrium tenue]|nr:hypothetical protein HK405_007780 [Cladochytrium tenue]
MRGETMPQLELLAARFKDRTGGYTRLTLSGYHSPGSDSAPLAIVEFIDSKKDTTALLGKRYIDKVRQDLADVQGELRQERIHKLIDPITGAEAIVKAWTSRSPNITFSKIAYLTRRERVLQRRVDKLERAMVSVGRAQKNEEDKLEELFATLESWHGSILQRLEEQLQGLEDASAASLLRGLVHFYFPDSPLLSPELAHKNRLAKRVRRGQDGRLFWFKQEAEPSTDGATVLTITPDVKTLQRMQRDRAYTDRILRRIGVHKGFTVVE